MNDEKPPRFWVKEKPSFMTAWMWRIMRPMWPKRELYTLDDALRYFVDTYGGVYSPKGFAGYYDLTHREDETENDANTK